MKTLKIIIICSFTLFLGSCVSTQIAKIQRPLDKNVEIYISKLPDRQYTELFYIQADGSIFHRPEKLLSKLSERAKKEGADAIINVQYGYQFWWPNVSGIAIKYK